MPLSLSPSHSPGLILWLISGAGLHIACFSSVSCKLIGLHKENQFTNTHKCTHPHTWFGLSFVVLQISNADTVDYSTFVVRISYEEFYFIYILFSMTGDMTVGFLCTCVFTYHSIYEWKPVYLSASIRHLCTCCFNGKSLDSQLHWEGNSSAYNNR